MATALIPIHAQSVATLVGVIEDGHAQLSTNECEACNACYLSAISSGALQVRRCSSAMPNERGGNANTDGIGNGLGLATSGHRDALYTRVFQRLQVNPLYNQSL